MKQSITKHRKQIERIVRKSEIGTNNKEKEKVARSRKRELYRK